MSDNLPRPVPTVETVKVWSLLGLRSIDCNHSGGWRLWTLAKAIPGSRRGWVYRTELKGVAQNLKVKPKTLRRWWRDAEQSGLFRVKKNRERVYLAGLADAAVKLKCERIGKPALIPARALVKKGWRRFVWGAFLVGLHERPVSQISKWRMTRVKPRRQSNLQRGIGQAWKNYTVRGKGDKEDWAELRLQGYAVFFHKGVIFQRLPNAFNVFPQVAKSCPTGSSKKVQSKVSHLIFQSAPGDARKLFYDTYQGSEKAAKRRAREENPADVFRLHNVYVNKHKTTWELVR